VLPDLPLPAFNTRELPFSLVAVRRTRHAIAMWCCLMELAKKIPKRLQFRTPAGSLYWENKTCPCS
jgi:hypothetical protein